MLMYGRNNNNKNLDYKSTFSIKKKIQRRILKQHPTILGTVEKKSEDIYLEYCTNGGGAENSENLKKIIAM